MRITIMFIICCLGLLVPPPSGALTVEEILLLKQNGVCEETVQMMLQSEIQARSLQSSAVGLTMGIQTITRPGGHSAIVYATGSADQDSRSAQERLKEERAWEMLRRIIVDTRVSDDRRRRSDN